jgi:hypothetical protein
MEKEALFFGFNAAELLRLSEILTLVAIVVSIIVFIIFPLIRSFVSAISWRRTSGAAMSGWLPGLRLRNFLKGFLLILCIAFSLPDDMRNSTEILVLSVLVIAYVFFVVYLLAYTSLAILAVAVTIVFSGPSQIAWPTLRQFLNWFLPVFIVVTGYVVDTPQMCEGRMDECFEYLFAFIRGAIPLLGGYIAVGTAIRINRQGWRTAASSWGFSTDVFVVLIVVVVAMTMDW